MSNVKYYKFANDFYKVNHDLKRITRIADGGVEYLDYDSNVEDISGYKKIQMHEWKQAENGFFISREFVWKYERFEYTTTQKPLEWKPASTCGREAIVFHNGKIWRANDYYYPRISLRRIETINRPHIDISNEENYVAWLQEHKKNTKWTDVKYCRHFELIPIDVIKIDYFDKILNELTINVCCYGKHILSESIRHRYAELVKKTFTIVVDDQDEYYVPLYLYNEICDFIEDEIKPALECK